MKKNILLVGFMGSGKSTVGQILASRLHWSFVDLDEQIVITEGCSINQIFDDQGETAFRACETRQLQQYVSCQKMVLATGGGVIGLEENWSLMRKTGAVVYLHSEWETIQHRLHGSTERPLVNQGSDEQLRQLYLKRLPLYRQADHCVATDGLNPEQVVEQILSFL